MNGKHCGQRHDKQGENLMITNAVGKREHSDATPSQNESIAVS